MRYDAFISYRHSELDMYIAKKVHKGLETFKVPGAVARKNGKKKINRVFRDQEELPIGSDLGNNIQAALAESEFLIVICSPRTPESYWVLKEIDTFIAMHGREHVLAVLIEGEPQDAFPKQLQMDEDGNPVEPLAADVRGETRREIDRKMRTELVRLSAPLLQCSYDDLRQRHRERRMRKMVYAASAVAALSVAFGVYSAYNTAMIRENYRQKQINQSKYLASTSLELLETGDRQTAALVALEALPSAEDDRPYVASAQYALSRALNCYDTGNTIDMDRNLKHDLPVREFVFDETGERLLSVDQGGTIYVWNIEDGMLLAKLPPALNGSGGVRLPVSSKIYGQHILVCDMQEMRCVTFEGEVEWQQEGIFTYCEIDPEAGLVVGIMGEQLSFYDIDTGELKYTVENGQEDSFSSAHAFSADKARFAVCHLRKGEGMGLVTVCDLAAGDTKVCEVEGSYVSEVGFTADGGLIVVSLRESDLTVSSIGYSATGFVERIDCESGERVWIQEFEYQPYGPDEASAVLKCRKYQDENTGIVYDQVMLSIDQTAYTWDAATGEAVAQVRVTGGIRSFRVSSNTCFGYLAESNGTVDIVDMNRGVNYSNLGIETGKNLTSMNIRNGAMVVSAYASPALTVMKYHEGYGMQELADYEDNVSMVYYSENESYYAVSVPSYQDSVNRIYFYRGEDDSPSGQWNRECEYGIYADAGFIDDTQFVFVESRGAITFYDVTTGETETLDWGQDGRSLECVCDWDHSRILLYGASQYYVIDLQQRTLLYSGEVQDYINYGILSEDGGKIYWNLRDQGLCAMDAASGSVEVIVSEEYRLVNGIDGQKALALSPDGGLLAAACVDRVLRVIDLEHGSIVAEIPFSGVNRRFVKFSSDGERLMLQGDDYYFRVYDLKKQEFAYIAAAQYYQISRADVNEKSGTISLVTSSDMVILDAAIYERVAQADGGIAYLPGQGAVFSRRYGKLYRFPYMNLEMLLEEAKAQFGDAELTQLERTQYNVE